MNQHLKSTYTHQKIRTKWIIIRWDVWILVTTYFNMQQLIVVINSFCHRPINIKTNLQSPSVSRDVIHNKDGMISVEAAKVYACEWAINAAVEEVDNRMSVVRFYWKNMRIWWKDDIIIDTSFATFIIFYLILV